MKIIPIYLVCCLLCLCNLACAKNYEYTGDCLFNGDTYDFEACLSSELALYDKQLNKLYRKQNQASSFKKAEIAWIRFKEADCEFMASEVNEGVEFNTIYTVCLINKTKARIQDLKRSFFYSDWFKKK